MSERKTLFYGFPLVHQFAMSAWSGHCKRLAEIWDRLGEHFRDDQKTVIAQVDITRHELHGFDRSGTTTFPVPRIKLFREDNSVVDYTGTR